MKNAFLVGPNLYFRPLEREDARRLAGFLNDPQVRRTLLWHRPLSVGSEEAFLASMANSPTDVMFGIVESRFEELIGVTGLHKLELRDQRGDFGLLIGDKERWGQGFGTEATRMMLDYAFGTLNLHKVTLEVFSNNPAAERVYVKAGFQREGVLRQEHFTDGQWVDGIRMGILREEWTRFLPPGGAVPQSDTP